MDKEIKTTSEIIKKHHNLTTEYHNAYVEDDYYLQSCKSNSITCHLLEEWIRHGTYLEAKKSEAEFLRKQINILKSEKRNNEILAEVEVKIYERLAELEK